uniref:Uncharacterized protein n=1 Tax=Lepeophtheirus salmonis TaxID=72036 RepID=A0A0K2TDF6_LEPSM
MMSTYVFSEKKCTLSTYVFSEKKCTLHVYSDPCSSDVCIINKTIKSKKHRMIM